MKRTSGEVHERHLWYITYLLGYFLARFRVRVESLLWHANGENPMPSQIEDWADGIRVYAENLVQSSPARNRSAIKSKAERLQQLLCQLLHLLREAWDDLQYPCPIWDRE